MALIMKRLSSEKKNSDSELCDFKLLLWKGDAPWTSDDIYALSLIPLHLLALWKKCGCISFTFPSGCSQRCTDLDITVCRGGGPRVSIPLTKSDEEDKDASATAHEIAFSALAARIRRRKMKNTTRVDNISVTELFREGEKATWSAWSKKNKPVLLVSFFKKI